MPSRTILATELATLLRQISHPDRIRLIEVLQVGGDTVNEIAANLGIAATRVSQHLRVLKFQGIVRVKSRGQSRLYHLTQPELATWLVDGIGFVAIHLTQADRTEIEEAKTLSSVRSAGVTIAN